MGAMMTFYEVIIFDNTLDFLQEHHILRRQKNSEI